MPMSVHRETHGLMERGTLHNMSDACPNQHIEHLDGALECLADQAPECDHQGRPARRMSCTGAYSELCPYCTDHDLA